MKEVIELNLEVSNTSDEKIENKVDVKTSLLQHNILSKMLNEIQKIDFREKTGFSDSTQKLEKKHYLITCIDEILIVANQNNWGLCKRNGFLYVYNGTFWQQIEKEELEDFLANAAEKMGIDKFDAKHYAYREELFRQFLASAKLPIMKENDQSILINLSNGTFEIESQNQNLRAVNRNDFMTYQLPFEYNSTAQAPMFQAYLDKVLPDVESQRVLAEYIGYLFIKSGNLKLEKTLLLFGGGANGKSVFFEIINALLGSQNVSNFSLQSLTNDNGYFRAKIANKLLNYASEINNKLSADIFKQLVSCEPVEARLPYGEPFTLTNYAKLIFNCNELPKDIEQTNAFFRRFLIIPFEVTIPEAEQDKELAKKIIDNELSGVFNWVLEGLNRLLSQKKFSKCDAVEKQVEQYKVHSDSVRMFLEDENYEKAITTFKYLKDLVKEYKDYCQLNGFRACSTKTLSERLKNIGFESFRKNQGWVIYLEKKSFLEVTQPAQPTLFAQSA